MARNDNTSAVVDGILRFVVTTSTVAAGLLLPNLLIALDKPLGAFSKQLDKRQRERELRRVISYMKSSQLMTGDYEHGLQLTDKGRRRLADHEFDTQKIKPPEKWDGRWRLVIYDIPETQRLSRRLLAGKLHELGFYQLQRSAWLHPFPCREIIEVVAATYSVDRYVSYLEVAAIDNQKVLINRYGKKYPRTVFK